MLQSYLSLFRCFLLNILHSFLKSFSIFATKN